MGFLTVMGRNPSFSLSIFMHITTATPQTLKKVSMTKPYIRRADNVDFLWSSSDSLLMMAIGLDELQKLINSQNYESSAKVGLL
ncbi:MAG: hypothetical protein VKJ04_02935 [Vampirovibrionales bacterium]|nr:hypothetical protein [Vampirovibrionales bacterium]